MHKRVVLQGEPRKQRVELPSHLLEMLMQPVDRGPQRTEQVRLVLVHPPLEERMDLAVELGGHLLAQHAKRLVRRRQVLACAVRRDLHASNHGSERADVAAGSGRDDAIEEVDRVAQPLPGFAAKDGARSPRRWHPCLSATRHPAKLPLSTVETYCGRSGWRFFVSYQLSRCPW